MFFRKLTLIVSLLLIVQVNSTGAVMLVDTGPGPSGAGGYTIGMGQSLGAEFTLTTGATITDIDGWIATVVSGPVLLGIYSDGGDIPGTMLFSDTFVINSSIFEDKWQGLSNLDWFLSPDTYWVTFEQILGEATWGFMSGPAVSPLGLEAFTISGTWISGDTMDFGVRIEGIEGTPVPEPSTFTLLGAGLAGLVAWRRKRS